MVFRERNYQIRGIQMTDKRTEHMEKRRSRGQTIREIAEEFGIPKSTVHRKLQSESRPALLDHGIGMEPGK